MNILIYQSLGSEIILEDSMLLEEQKAKYELTNDNFIRNVRGFIRNESGQILMVHDKRYNRRSVPGGKVDIGETLDQALEKEITEELGVTIKSKEYIGGRKCYMRGSKGCNAWMAHYYDISVSGDIKNNEEDKAESVEFLTLYYDNSKHLIQVDALGNSYIGSDIYDKFPGLHTLVDVLPYMPKNIEDVESATFDLPNIINPNKIYQQRYDTEKKKYFITEL